MINPPAPTCGGTTAADIGYRLLFNRHRSCFHLFSHLLFSCVQARNSAWFKLATAFPLDPVPPRKSINFQACFQSSKNHKTSQKRQERLRNQWKTIYVKSCFLQYLTCDSLFLGAPAVQISTRASVHKSDLGTSPKTNWHFMSQYPKWKLSK